MRSGARHTPAAVAAALVFAVSVLSGCSSNETPTSPDAGATLSGTVVSGTSRGLAPLGIAAGLQGVTVRVAPNGASTQTDANGEFLLKNVPHGSVELHFDRADLHAKGTLSVSAGATLVVTVSIVDSSAVIVAGGHAGEEIEGLILSVDAAGKGLKVQDQRLGTVQISVTDTTVIRHGQTSIALADLVVGWRVHVKAMLGTDGVYVATEVIVQDENTGGGGGDPTTQTANGHIESIDAGAKSFVVLKANGGHGTVMTDGSTTFKKHGQSIGFDALAVGNQVECQGTPQTDGSILARQVIVQ
jgi:hypothetical protein